MAEQAADQRQAESEPDALAGKGVAQIVEAGIFNAGTTGLHPGKQRMAGCA
jgi:hypothetical protein